MPKVVNILDQPLVINCKGRVLHLLPGQATAISDAELQSENVQSLLRQRALDLIQVKAQEAAKKLEETPVPKRGEDATHSHRRDKER
jgi:hypothetical protein